MSSSTYWERWSERNRSRRSLLAGSSVAAAGVAGLALVGCGGGDSSKSSATPGANQGNLTPIAPTQTTEKPVAGGVLRQAGGPIGSVLDIHQTNTPYESAGVWHWAGNFLMRFSAQSPNLPEPDLAAAQPEIPGDCTLLTFKLRPEAKWQNLAPVNGRQVTAEDVKATFERIKSLGAKSPRSGNYVNVESITAVDKTTVQFKLKAPQADLLSAMSDQYDLIIPKEIADRGVDAIKGINDVIGSGPYQLTTFEAGQRIVMSKRKDGYWKPNTAWLDGWDLVNMVDTQQLSNALKANQVDVVGLPVDLAKSYDGDKNYTITRAPNPTRECVLINHNKDRYKDARVRQAIWRAINRKQVYDTVFGGAGIPSGPMTPAASAWLLPDAELAKMPGFGDRATELKEAKALLSAAGLADGFEDTILTATAYNTNLVNDVVVSNLAEIGIKLKTENVGTDFIAMFTREVKRDYNLCTTLFLSGPYPDAQLFIYHHTGAGGSRNYADYGSAELDAMLDKQRGVYDTKARLPLVQDIQRYIINNPGPAWVGSRIDYTVANARVRNRVATPFLAGYPTAENVWLKQG